MTSDTVPLEQAEYTALRMVATVALGLCARYPFDDAEQMAPRWAALAQWLACLPDYDEEVTHDVSTGQ